MFEKFIDKQVHMGIVKASDAEIYKYGYALAFDAITNIIAGIIIGLIFRAIPIVLLFWISYIPLRVYAGGWHAKRSIHCFLISNILLIVVIQAIRYINIPIETALCNGLEFLEISFIIGLAPVDTKNKRLSSKEKRKYKYIVIAVICIEVLIGIWSDSFRKICIVTYVILMFSLLYGLVPLKAEKQDVVD